MAAQISWHRAGLVPALVSLAICALAQMASGTERLAWTTSRVHGSPEPPAPYRIAAGFPKLRFELPTCIEELPDGSRLIVTERGGKVFSFPKNSEVTQPDLIVDLRQWLPTELATQNVSLLDAELHPKFTENHSLFVCYVHPGEGGHTRLSRLTLTADAVPRAVAGSEQVLLTWPSGGHNAGCLEFGPDGTLYIATGDGSGPNPPDGRTTGQDVSDLLGAILRIDVDHPVGDQRYSVPADNPFVNTAGARPEIWGYGLRNPWKFGVDACTGDLFAADNGWETWEMVHRVGRGTNCGWPVMEGRVSLRSEVKPGPTPIVPPVKDHPHTEANSVIGGPVYRGSKLPDLAGSFVYGDYITGTIWSIRPDKNGAYSHQTLVDTDQRIVAFHESKSGELYVLDYDLTGQIYELLPSGLPDTTATFPRRLSETGLFNSLSTMHPAAGVVPYSILVEPWMDGAEARRWVAVPGNGEIELAAELSDSASYPDGTVLVKHLTLPQEGRDAIRLETQLLHYENGIWRPYSYLWDESNTDATLVDSIGANRPLRLADPETKGGYRERTWHVNAVNECKLCHNAGPKFVLGFVANQLNRPAGGGESTGANQLAMLAAQGVLEKQLVVPSDSPLKLVDPHDTTQSLDDRARSYLHANCSMCHHPGGNAIVSFFLRRDLPFEKLNTNKGTGIGTFGIKDAKIIATGAPYRSILLYRMAKLGYARMPYIGSQVVDSFGVPLIADWIRSLPGVSTTRQTSSITDTPFNSTESALDLAVELHRGAQLPGRLDAASSQGSKVPSGDIRGLFETFIPESQRRATLGANIDPQAILSRKGDLQRGKLIFFSDGARCRACHEIDNAIQSVGPTLQEINKRYPRLSDLLQHVVQPSLKIDDAFAAYSVLTDDGRAISGLMVEQNDQQVTLKTADKKLVMLSRDDIAQLQKSTQSLMPDRILSDLTAQEATDLFAYIQSLGAAK